MYSDKENVNILTALLVAHGVRHAVVCPGSRNAPIVHNLNECPGIKCYPVTDERSAGFFALGIAQATDTPVIVCVTSGTALLNVAPAVAEAHYQHQSLIVISADRPTEWIDQLDGQTLWQPGALASWVSKTVNLPEIPPTLNSQSSILNSHAWYCNRLVNEALLDATSAQHACIHINVPISEPLFQFTTETLPHERAIYRYTPTTDHDYLPQPLLDDFLQSKQPLLIFGQLTPRRFHYEGMEYLFSHVIVLHEALSPLTSVSHFEEALDALTAPSDALLPDFILYVGDAIVSKRLKHFLRQATKAHTWRISLTGMVEDTFQNLHGMVVGDAETILQALSNKLAKHRCCHSDQQANYRRLWLHLLQQAKQKIMATTLPYGEAAAVQLFEQQLQQVKEPYEVHYANSLAVRLANTFAQGHPVWCNRGVNGIEGSLSTAVGFAAALPSSLVFCIIGDLSFFYDQNALWNQNVSGNLRILLLNNGHGAIFDQLPGLSQSPVARRFISGAHQTTADGCCHQHDIAYQKAENMTALQQGINWLLFSSSDRPCLLEVSI